jgi:hypothetical protein
VRLPHRIDAVVEIDPLEASLFNGFQKPPTRNHKDLRVGNLVPNRIQAIIEICGILRTATVLFRMACHTPIERCCALMFLDAFAAPKSTTAQVSFNRTTRDLAPKTCAVRTTQRPESPTAARDLGDPMDSRQVFKIAAIRGRIDFCEAERHHRILKMVTKFPSRPRVDSRAYGLHRKRPAPTPPRSRGTRKAAERDSMI